jgi:hypothetical protein
MQETIETPCPYCGGMNDITIEPGHADQEWIEDCTVCCQPILFTLQPDGTEWLLNADRP